MVMRFQETRVRPVTAWSWYSRSHMVTIWYYLIPNWRKQSRYTTSSVTKCMTRLWTHPYNASRLFEKPSLANLERISKKPHYGAEACWCNICPAEIYIHWFPKVKRHLDPCQPSLICKSAAIIQLCPIAYYIPRELSEIRTNKFA